MLPARFRILERWLLRSRLLLAAVASAHAPVRFLAPFPRFTTTEETQRAHSDAPKPAVTSLNLLGDSASIDEPPEEYIWPSPQWPASPISDYPSSIEIWPNPQFQSDGGASPSNIEPAAPPAIDLPLESTTVAAAGFDFSPGGISVPISNPVQPIKPVPVTPGTPVPEPGEFCFIATALLALRRNR
jgi:hypothetical protein